MIRVIITSYMNEFWHTTNSRQEPLHFSPVHYNVILSTLKIIYKKWYNNALARSGTWQELVARLYK